MGLHDFAVAAAQALREVVRPLEDAFLTPEAANMLLLRHGWMPPDDEAYVDGLSARFDLVPRIAAMVSALEEIVGQPDPPASDVQVALEAGLDFLGEILAMVSGPVPPGLPGVLGSAEFWSEFPRDLYANLFADYVRIIHPVAFALLQLGGVIRRTRVPAANQPGRVDYTRTELHWSRLMDLVSDPRAWRAMSTGGGTCSTTGSSSRACKSRSPRSTSRQTFAWRAIHSSRPTMPPTTRQSKI